MCNMERIRLKASERMSFENVDGWTADVGLYNLLNYETTAQVS